jgi:hypothetical protein
LEKTRWQIFDDGQKIISTPSILMIILPGIEMILLYFKNLTQRHRYFLSIVSLHNPQIASKMTLGKNSTHLNATILACVRTSL